MPQVDVRHNVGRTHNYSNPSPNCLIAAKACTDTSLIQRGYSF